MSDAADTSDARTGAARCRGVRGATVASDNSREAIREAIRDLVAEIVERNGIDPDDLASAMFTTTPDLDAAFPAEAIRHMGWEYVPMLGAVEMAKPGAPERCIRVLLLWNTTRGPREIAHVYQRGTEVLRTAGRAEDQAPTERPTTPEEGPT
jgi:chorismate mutase